MMRLKCAFLVCERRRPAREIKSVPSNLCFGCLRDLYRPCLPPLTSPFFHFISQQYSQYITQQDFTNNGLQSIHPPDHHPINIIENHGLA
jgi:hypothetical protein